MSLVTSVVITCPTSSQYIIGTRNQWINLVNDWLKENYDRDCSLFVNVLDKYEIPGVAGNKHPQSCLYIGGFNFFPNKDFAEFFNSLGWENALLLIRSENWDSKPHLVFPILTEIDYRYTEVEPLFCNPPNSLNIF